VWNVGNISVWTIYRWNRVHWLSKDIASFKIEDEVYDKYAKSIARKSSVILVDD